MNKVMIERETLEEALTVLESYVYYNGKKVRPPTPCEQHWQHSQPSRPTDGNISHHKD